MLIIAFYGYVNIIDDSNIIITDYNNSMTNSIHSFVITWWTFMFYIRQIQH